MKGEYKSWEYTVKEGQKLRRGYTTGTCAAAAAKAAVKMLFSGEEIWEIEVYLPAGITISLPLQDVAVRDEEAVCSVKKDSGDDPDKTAGIKVFASAVKNSPAGIEVEAGEGIGTVTSPGLQVEVGKSAINPVPMEMILQETSKVLPPGEGSRVMISVPGGAELAEKTFNSRLGIEGGLSILGTTGIVEPMSHEAVCQTLALEMKIAAQNLSNFVVLVPGNYGRDIASKLGFSRESIVKMSNFVGFMLDRCLEENIAKILLVGHLGKLSKVAGGIFQTHSRVADARFEIFAAHAALHGASTQLIRELNGCNSSEEIAEKLVSSNMESLFPLLASEVSSRAREYLYDQVDVGTVLFTMKRGVVGMDNKAKELVEEFSCQKS